MTVSLVGETPLKENLVAESNGMISSGTAPLSLNVSYAPRRCRLEEPFYMDPHILMGTLSFVLPPFAFVDTSDDAEYKAGYELMDSSGRIVRSKNFEGAFHGIASGWWLARLFAGQDLCKEFDVVMRKDASRKITNDIRYNWNSIVPKPQTAASVPVSPPQAGLPSAPNLIPPTPVQQSPAGQEQKNVDGYTIEITPTR